MANSTITLARAETFVEVYQDLMTQYEIEMDVLIQGGESTRAQSAALRTEINKVRALIGYWRGEASFWRQEINENKQALAKTNELAKGGG